MLTERKNPPELREYPGTTHIVRATGGTTLYLSGQAGHRGEDGSDNYYEQTKEALTKVLTALASEGATFDDVVKATYYVVRMTPQAFSEFSRATREVLGQHRDLWPAATIVGVHSLAFEDMLVEIDVTAVVG